MCCRQIVNVQALDHILPSGHDGGHVHPRDIWSGERVLQSLFGLVDLCDAQNVVNVSNEGDSLGRNQVGGRIASLNNNTSVEVKAYTINGTY